MRQTRLELRKNPGCLAKQHMMIEVRSGFLSSSPYQATTPLDKNYFPRYSICMDDQTATKQKKTWTHQADNRARLIAAGYTILSEKGIEATTVKEIANLAGVSPGLFHYYFASKDELLLAVLYEAGKRFSQQLEHELQALIASGNTFPDVAMLTVARRVGSRDPAWY